MARQPDPDLYAAFRFADEIEAEAVRWLWPGRIPLGKVSLLIGDPGVGKSLLAVDLAARVSAGLEWPASVEGGAAPAGGSNSTGPVLHRGGVIIASEDSPADTLQPRLAAAGAELGSICILEGVRSSPASFRSDRLCGVVGHPGSGGDTAASAPFLLPAHALILEEAVRAVTQPRLVILDPLDALLGCEGQVGSRPLAAVLAALSDTARTYGVAIVAVGHLAKARAHNALYRVRGSLALVAAARSVLLVSVDPSDGERRILFPLKTVFGRPAGALSFRIGAGPRLEWERSGVEGGGRGWSRASDLLDLSIDARTALCEASDWLVDFLCGGARAAVDILRAGRAAGHSASTLRRAKRILGVRSLKPSAEAGWLWSQGDDRPQDRR